MCSVGDPFNIDISSEDTGLCEYKCNDCGKQFKGIRIGRGLKCPECHSTNTSQVQG